MKHWEALLRENEKDHFLRVCPKLTKDHLNPKGYQKMKVRMAYEVRLRMDCLTSKCSGIVQKIELTFVFPWQFWSSSVASGMEFYQQKGVSDLQDATETINLVKKIDAVAGIMNSRLRPNSPESQVSHFQPFLRSYKRLLPLMWPDYWIRKYSFCGCHDIYNRYSFAVRNK